MSQNDPKSDDGLELNLDGIVGPTHSFAGLSYGNLASQRHRLDVSNPRQAALEGLAKMKRLSDLGVPQAVLPPQERPDVEALRRLGFDGPNEAAVLDRAGRDDPALLAACCSASAMWAANAATVSPSPDTADGRVHFTPANLVSQFHRSLEPPTTSAVLKAVFDDERHFVHHAPLLSAGALSDEGAANHMRLCRTYGSPGIEVFVFGRSALRSGGAKPSRFPARQTLEASLAVARLHALRAGSSVEVHQHPDAIDAGAFHNDVVAVGNLDVLFFHAKAFLGGVTAVDNIRSAYEKTCGGDLRLIEVPEDAVSLANAVDTYLFNSQVVRAGGGRTVLVAPTECETHPRVRPYLDYLLSTGGPIGRVEFVNVRQSMRNGGGPACLRLRVALTREEFARVHRSVIFDDALYGRLRGWVERHYRDQLHPDDLRDVKLLEESRSALEELTRILEVGPVYRFQH